MKNGITDQDRKRFLLISLCSFIVFSILIVQFYKIQIIESDKWTKIAQSQQEWVVKIPFKRGGFFANTELLPHHLEPKQHFVIDVPKFHLFIDPLAIGADKKEDVAKKLIGFLQLQSQDTEQKKLRRQFKFKSRSRKVAVCLDRSLKEAIESWWFPFARSHRIAKNAIYFIQDYQRSYPFGKLLGQVLHSIRDTKDAVTKQAVPTGGLELSLNHYLSGKEGKRWYLRSLRKPLEAGEVIQEAKNGADVYLTVNHYLQAVAEEEIVRGVKRAKAKGGWALVMNPMTGELLALAQYPFFYPDRYQDFFNDPTLIEHTKVKAITDVYEPASTMKPLTLAVCLQANKALLKEQKQALFSPEEKIPSKDGRFQGRSHPLKDGREHAYLNTNLALQKSSNIYFAKIVKRLVDRLGNTWYRDTLESIFALGQPTGIEIPSEASGMLPKPGRMYASGLLEWSVATPYSLAIGHNLQVNALQMLRAYAVFANGGYLIDPIIVKKVVFEDAQGRKKSLVLKNQQLKKRRRVLDEDIVKTVVNAMKYVTKLGGTAYKADIKGYTESGKTGTAYKIVGGNYSKKHFFSTFVGFTPVHDARLVILVAIDEPMVRYIPGQGKNHHAGHCAAPVFREIAKRSLAYLGVKPDDPHGYGFGDPRYDREKSDWNEEIQDLKKLYQKWNDPQQEKL